MEYINICQNRVISALWRCFHLFVLALLSALNLNAVYSQGLSQADTLNKKRAKTAIVVGASAYALASAWMYTSWYADSKRTNMHSFNDWNEWRNLDKYGHATTSQYQSYLAYRGARWIGYDEKRSLLIASGTAMLLQSTVEIMDGFSAEWGFSWSDMGFNVAGISLFAFQQAQWGEQRIRLKMSTQIKEYSNSPISSATGAMTTTLNGRADDLFGKPFYERLLKDYNQQTYWLSFNLHAFNRQSKVPAWLNVAIGVGANNMFGGFSNSWYEENDEYSVDHLIRHTQYYLAPDVDWTQIKTESWFIKSLFDLMSVIKFPLPGLRYDSQSGMKWLWIAY